jgi:hypothetical protein
VVLLGVSALAVDLGNDYARKRSSQAATDLAAFAAGQAIQANPGSVTGATSCPGSHPNATDPAVVAAAKYLYANRPQNDTSVSAQQWTVANISANLVNCNTSNGELIYNSTTQVSVISPTSRVAFGMAAAFGANGITVQSQAQVTLSNGTASKCALCVIGSGTHSLNNGDVTETGGASIGFNGTVDLKQNGAVTATPGSIYVQNGTTGKSNYTPAVTTGQSIADPLAGLSLPPDYSGLTYKTSACGAGATHGPGIYSALNASGNCVLQPGLYVIIGSNHYSGQVDITATGVTLYFTCAVGTTPRACNNGESGGDLLMTGQASLTITAPTTGATTGLAIVSDRNNTATIGFRGNGAQTSSGTIYAKSGTLQYDGNGAGLSLDSLVVVNDLDMSGNPSNFNLSYTADNNVTLLGTGLLLTQ